MKKVFLVAFIMLFLICGCDSSSGVTANTGNIKFCFGLKRDKTEYAYEVETSKSGNIKLITALCPEEIKGICYTPKKDGIEFMFEGLSRILDINEVPKEIKTVIEVFPKFYGKNAEKNGKLYYCDFETKDNRYRLYVSPGGLPLKLTEEKNKICLSFNKVLLVNNQKK